jgi:hypothetical protein
MKKTHKKWDPAIQILDPEEHLKITKLRNISGDFPHKRLKMHTNNYN